VAQLVAPVAAPQQTRRKLQRASLTYAVVGERAVVLKLLAREGKALVLGWRAVLVADLDLDGCDGVGGLHIERDGVAAECSNENLKEESLSADELFADF
jgi:hypothetical protein